MNDDTMANGAQEPRAWGRRGFIGGLGVGTAGLLAAGAITAQPAAATTGAAAWSVYYVDISQGANEVPIQAALNAAQANGGGQVVLGPGHWVISNYLRITANIQLTLTPHTTLTRAAGSLQFMLINGTRYGTGNATDDAISGYGGYGNIIVEGGIWDVNGPVPSDTSVGYNGLSFSHAQNVTVRDLEVRNVSNWHAVKFQGVSNGTVENCRFIGYVAGPAAATRTESEAVSIDSCWAGTSMYNTAVGKADHTTCVDIRIINNYCDAGTSNNYPVFAGGHNGELGYWHHRVEISGNSVGNATSFAIYAFNTNQLIVSNNKIHDSFGGIRVSRDYSDDVQAQPHPAWDFIVSGNVLETITGDRGIEIFGGGTDTSQTPAIPATASRSVVTGNLVHTAQKAGIHALFAPDALVTGNLVYNIHGNDAASGITADGICVQNSPGANVNGNTIRTCDGYGVNFLSSPNGMATGNSLSAAALGAVNVSTDSANVLNATNLAF